MALTRPRLARQWGRTVRLSCNPGALDPDSLPIASHRSGKISLPSSIPNFFDLGGQRGIRTIWHRYYDDYHAVAYVIDAQDRERLSEGWDVFGVRRLRLSDFHLMKTITQIRSCGHPRSSTSPYSLQTSRIHLIVSRRRRFGMTTKSGISAGGESARRRFGEDEDAEMERKRQRIASLDVMGVSALDG